MILIVDRYQREEPLILPLERRCGSPYEKLAKLSDEVELPELELPFLEQEIDKCQFSVGEIESMIYEVDEQVRFDTKPSLIQLDLQILPTAPRSTAQDQINPELLLNHSQSPIEIETVFTFEDDSMNWSTVGFDIISSEFSVESDQSISENISHLSKNEITNFKLGFQMIDATYNSNSVPLLPLPAVENDNFSFDYTVSEIFLIARNTHWS